MQPSTHRGIYRAHPRWGHAFRANLAVRIVSWNPNTPGYLFETNHDGFRNAQPLHVFRNSPKKRVLVIGCSFIAGAGVSNKERFLDIIESRSDNVTFYNAGL